MDFLGDMERGDDAMDVTKIVNTPEPCSRKPHRKSRNGCLRCKRRKVKCDEKKPSCSNCAKHAVQCDFTATDPTTTTPPDPYHSPYAHTGSLSSHASPNFVATPALTSQYTTDSENLSLPTLNMLDMELFHNFYSSTCNTFHSDSAMKSLWRVNIPQLAFENDFVMRGLLALSALHLAYFRPLRRDFYLAQATAQHNAGLHQATRIISSTPEQNCHALYIFTGICCIYTLAAPRRPGDLLVVSDSGVAEWLLLFRGTRVLIEQNYQALKSGPLGPMFTAGMRRNELREAYENVSFPEADRLSELLRLIREVEPSDEDFTEHEAAIAELKKSYGMIFRQAVQSFEMSDIFVWFYRMSERFLEMLMNDNQETLVILAFYCVIPKRLEGHWWIDGWSAHIMSRLYNIMDEEHRLWIRWPIEEIGWVPS